MNSVKVLSSVLATDGQGDDRWYVSNGAEAIGPVKLELLARGVEAGRVPLESFIRHEAWKVWKPLREVVDGEAPLPTNSQRLDVRGEWPVNGGADATPLPGTAEAEVVLTTDDIVEPSRPAMPEERTPADALEGAADKNDVMLLLLSAVITACHAEGAIVHDVADEGATVMCAHGPRMFDLLGERTKLLDPMVVAAAAGVMVLAEPTPGPAGASMQARLMRLGIQADAALMLPIRPNGRLAAILEIGRAEPFKPAQIAGAAALVDAVVAKLESSELA